MQGKPRILFVDDEQLLLDGIRRSFRTVAQNQWDMTFETDPKAAIDLHHQSPFDVVVTDFMMPDMNGIELAQKIRESDEHTQIVMLTGAADLSTATNIINSTRVYRFFTKPCDMDVLFKGILDCIERHHEKTQTKPNTAPSLSDGILDLLSIGVVICESNGKTIFMNQLAAEICADKTVLTVDQTGVLRAAQSVNRDEFQTCLADTSKQDRAISLYDDHADKTITLIVSDIADASHNRVMILISDPKRHVAPSVDILQSIYSLPPSEARILHNIVQGFSLQETAQNMNITESSARTYLKRVFAKTNTKSQPELVRSVLLTPALYRHV